MKAHAGDHLIIAARTTGGTIRDGEILEVRGADGAPPYVVRWSDDGNTGLYFPGSDAHVTRAQTAEPTAASPQPDESTRTRSWRVDISVYEAGDETTAHAALVSEPLQRLDADAEAHRNPDDVAVAEIGDEIAVARALRRLSDRLFAAASADIESAQGKPAHITA